MAFTLDPPFVNVSLHDLPFAAAALDRDTVIVAANHTFLQLCGDPNSSPVGQRLSHIVVERDRPTVEEALHYLTTQENWPCQTCVMHAVRACPPILWLAISVVRLGPGSIVPYFSCLQVIARRRQSDSLLDDQPIVECAIPANGGSMSTKNDYSADEWKAISGAPMAAGLFITLSDASGPVGIAKEALAVGKAITDSAQGEAPEVVKALAEAVKSGGERPALPDLPMGDRAKTKDALIGTLKTAVGAIERKSPGEVDAYKTWLASVAAKVAQASKEGGFLGIGGTPVSRAEQEGLEKLADILGVNVRRAAP